MDSDSGLDEHPLQMRATCEKPEIHDIFAGTDENDLELLWVGNKIAAAAKQVRPPRRRANQ